jgi:glycosyltransferase involved in cell wall biosynthesis
LEVSTRSIASFNCAWSLALLISIFLCSARILLAHAKLSAICASKTGSAETVQAEPALKRLLYIQARSGMRVAVIHDWLYTLGGAEKVLASIMRCFPDADVYCLFDLLSKEDRASVGYKASKTSFLQRMPGIRSRHRLYLPLMPIAIEQFDLSAYDLIISSSYAVAKGVITGPDQLHIAYVHSPMRYAWDLQHQYLRESKMENGLKSVFARMLLHRMRLWDVRSAHGVDEFVSNSHFVARRIKKLYGRDAAVIHPPVDVPDEFVPVAKGNYFLTASRLVPYKNVRAIVEAFAHLPNQQLLVVGKGPERRRLEQIATPNVRFLGFVPDAELRDLMGRARGFIFAAEEDFGIVPLEAQGQGTPVLALGKGGARETIVTKGPKPTGMFFDTPNPILIAETVNAFLEDEDRFDPAACHANARRFSESRFQNEFHRFVMQRQFAFKLRNVPVRQVGRLARLTNTMRIGVAVTSSIVSKMPSGLR